MSATRGLYIFRNDLRLSDNPSLKATCEKVDELLLVYVVEERWFAPNQFGLVALGQHRQRFLMESLSDLATRLGEHGQNLWVIQGDFTTVYETLIQAYQPHVVGMAECCGVYEQKQSNSIAYFAEKAGAKLISDTAECLFDRPELPFDLSDMPNVFSPFRRKIEQNLTPKGPTTTLSKVPPISIAADDCLAMFTNVALDSTHSSQEHRHTYPKLKGGETAAQQQLNFYTFESDLIATYKETRNGLDGWEFSSKLSAWLALGCLSPRQAYAKICEYEANVCANQSTYWMYFELLWREFFHWQAYKHEDLLFKFAGIQQRSPSTEHNQDKFKRWQNGETGFGIVDACMRQLTTIGFMSNRGRQLVASCFVHELGLDWRYGAAFFEQELIDYDVASNWGNWQYLAGVGSDPRGHRQFNLEKQTQQYDPDGSFRRQWL
ncbi:DASH family cryptochrome [Alteromonas flava]|uniref:DASH family cryptochrome n=1 Tax=Alteromonas flava TaxID=2048003 RepID=UPI000C2909DF|nr:DASH family cryptochrome [Alteromonas flava]